MSELWSLDDIAEKLRTSRRLVQEKIVRRPDFPRPAIALSQKFRRWSVEDVEGWIEAQKAACQR